MLPAFQQKEKEILALSEWIREKEKRNGSRSVRVTHGGLHVHDMHSGLINLTLPLSYNHYLHDLSERDEADIRRRFLRAS